MILRWTLKILSFLVCLLPYVAVVRIGNFLGKLYYFIAKKQRIRAEKTIMERMEYDEAQAKEIIHAMCRNLGMTVLEILYIPRLNKDNVREFVKIDNEQVLWDALKGKKGVVLLSCHMDNWEWLGAALSLRGMPITAPAKQQPNHEYFNFMNDLRRSVGQQIVQRGTGEVIGCAKAIKRGRIVGLVADQDGGYNGIFVPFLGKMASTPVGPVYFARRFGAPVIPIFVVRNESGYGHRAFVEEPLYYINTGDQEKDDYSLTLAYTKCVEKYIGMYPSNWLWFQHRWNTPYEEAIERRK